MASVLWLPPTIEEDEEVAVEEEEEEEEVGKRRYCVRGKHVASMYCTHRSVPPTWHKFRSAGVT